MSVLYLRGEDGKFYPVNAIKGENYVLTDDDKSEIADIARYRYTKLYDTVEITADDITAAGDEGITVISIGSDDVDLTSYNDFAIKIYVPADETLNTSNKNLSLYCTSNDVFSTADNNILLRVQGTAVTSGLIKSASNNLFMIRAHFAGDILLYGEIIKHNDAASAGYPGTSHGWVKGSSGFKKSAKKYFHVYSAYGGFKFPAGSYVEVYAR